MQYIHKDPKQQIEILKSRNMKFSDEKKAAKTLAYVSYYKIKNFAEPYALITNEKNLASTIDYRGVYFETIISRYYQDKNFRQNLLHALEDIEVALQTQMAYVLGKNYSAYGYLDFSTWSDRQNNKIETIQQKEAKIKRKIKNQVRHNKDSIRDINEKLQYGDNKEFPPIWLATTQLMFGDLVQMLNIMSKNNLSEISNYFGCSNLELKSWMKLLNLIRNIAAHNSNLIDIKIKTPPITRKDWEVFLYKPKENLITNKISVAIVIIKYFMDQINPNYYFDPISLSIQKLTNGDINKANFYGFKTENSMQQLAPLPKNKFKRLKNSKSKNSYRI